VNDVVTNNALRFNTTDYPNTCDMKLPHNNCRCARTCCYIDAIAVFLMHVFPNMHVLPLLTMVLAAKPTWLGSKPWPAGATP